jgi:hypothetical protein
VACGTGRVRSNSPRLKACAAVDGCEPLQPAMKMAKLQATNAPRAICVSIFENMLQRLAFSFPRCLSARVRQAASFHSTKLIRTTYYGGRGLRVRSKHLERIGKEVDRLDEDEGAALQPELPIAYERDDLDDDVGYLSQFQQKAVAEEIGMSERRWRDIAAGRAMPREATAQRIRKVAERWRLGSAAPVGPGSRPPKRQKAP